MPYVTFVYNATVHATTACTPFMLVYGQEAQYPVDIMYPRPAAEVTANKPLQTYVQDMLENFHYAHEVARSNLGDQQRRQADIYQRKVHGDPYEPGDLVYLHAPYKALSKKFHTPWEGPYCVKQRIDKDYIICPGKIVRSGIKTQMVHFNRLKPYNVREVEPTKKTRAAATAGRKRILEAHRDGEDTDVSDESEEEPNMFHPETLFSPEISPPTPKTPKTPTSKLQGTFTLTPKENSFPNDSTLADWHRKCNPPDTSNLDHTPLVEAGGDSDSDGENGPPFQLLFSDEPTFDAAAEEAAGIPTPGGTLPEIPTTLGMTQSPNLILTQNETTTPSPVAEPPARRLSRIPVPANVPPGTTSSRTRRPPEKLRDFVRASYTKDPT